MTEKIKPLVIIATKATARKANISAGSKEEKETAAMGVIRKPRVQEGTLFFSVIHPAKNSKFICCSYFEIPWESHTARIMREKVVRNLVEKETFCQQLDGYACLIVPAAQKECCAKFLGLINTSDFLEK